MPFWEWWSSLKRANFQVLSNIWMEVIYQVQCTTQATWLRRYLTESFWFLAFTTFQFFNYWVDQKQKNSFRPWLQTYICLKKKLVLNIMFFFSKKWRWSCLGEPTFKRFTRKSSWRSKFRKRRKRTKNCIQALIKNWITFIYVYKKKFLKHNVFYEKLFFFSKPSLLGT